MTRLERRPVEGCDTKSPGQRTHRGKVPAARRGEGTTRLVQERVSSIRQGDGIAGMKSPGQREWG